MISSISCLFRASAYCAGAFCVVVLEHEERRKRKGWKAMTKQETYIRYFETENDALTRCELKNRACKRAGNYRDIYAVVDGPEDNFAVVDLSTAIELGFGYQIAG